MIAKTDTCSLLGIDAILVEVEVDLSSGFPGFAIVRVYLTPSISGTSFVILGFHYRGIKQHVIAWLDPFRPYTGAVIPSDKIGPKCIIPLQNR